MKRVELTDIKWSGGRDGDVLPWGLVMGADDGEAPEETARRASAAFGAEARSFRWRSGCESGERKWHATKGIIEA